MNADATVLYLARDNCPAENELATDIGRRLALPVSRLVVPPGRSVDSLLSDIDRRLAKPDRERITVIVVNAFLGLSSAEYRSGSKWPHRPDDLSAQLDLHAGHEKSSECLLSLRLVWALWARGRTEVPVLVATASFSITPETRLALAEAFGDGLACVLEDWRGRWREFSLRSIWKATA